MSYDQVTKGEEEESKREKIERRGGGKRRGEWADRRMNG